jgi:tetratricopeptide (TPR) repeat protein
VNLKKTRAINLLVIAHLVGCLLVCGERVAAAQTPEQILKLGLFYYNNDDISDKAATQFRLLTQNKKYSKTKEAETAQYYLGSYYQRKYYLLKLKYLKEDKAALASAKREYQTYTDKYYKSGTHQWLADAFFNLALVYLQMGDARNAGFELNKMDGAAKLDNSVYIFQVIYSQNKTNVLDRYFPTAPLADYTSSLVKDPRQSFDQKIAAIREWCSRPA